MKYQIAASLLSADFARLGEQAKAVLDSGADRLHFDVMDNHFVPNLTVGPLVCDALRRYGIQSTINVHLMATPVDRLIVEFANAGASGIIFHPEASDNVERDLALIRKHKCQSGLALNPETTSDCLNGLWDKLDYVLVMSVHPGFGGQKFIPDTFDKIKKIRALISSGGHKIGLGVDGGIKVENIAHVAQAGADAFVIGSGIFTHPDETPRSSANNMPAQYRTVISEMRRQLLRSEDERQR